MGLYAAGLGASRVLLTDGSPSALKNASRNIDANRNLLGGCDIRVQPLTWGKDEVPRGPWGWVLASDAVYRGDSAGWRDLSSTVRSLLVQQARTSARPPRVLLATPHRNPGPVLSRAFMADAQGLIARELEVSRSSGPLPVSIIELSLQG